MSKKILALILVLVLVVMGFAGCKKDKKSEFFYVDEEGSTYYVEVDDEGKYYTTDENGNVSYVEDEKIIEQIEENSEAVKLEQIADEIGTDPDKIFDNPDKENGLQMSDDLVKDEIVTVAPDKGETDATERLSVLQDALKTNKFTISATIKEVGSETAEYPFMYIRSGNGAYIETAVPFDENGKVIKANMVIKDGVTYCVIPSINSYMIVDDMSIDDLADGTFDADGFSTYSFVESGTVTLNGKKYICDVFKVDNDTMKYYYDSKNNLVRIEKIGNRESVITEIKSIKNSADESKIKKPKGINLTSLLG